MLKFRDDYRLFYEIYSRYSIFNMAAAILDFEIQKFYAISNRVSRAAFIDETSRRSVKNRGFEGPFSIFKKASAANLFTRKA